ncbi:hypothetical protein PIB30_070606 [Stylosanthes scabra]|uniref:Endonuclease/exonuclease/phosphatase domain-containing protein n=1 Tax=Stylosanthes scabra TaxID=79078 RepID=A0ABU6SP81_9FABA|nr:hypothetical protein [Stylosanthes scabra]
MVWNVRGLGEDRRIEMVKMARRKNRVDFLGVVETKKECIDMALIMKLWGGGNNVRWEIVEKNFNCAICVVYGPHGKEEKAEFLKELREIKKKVDVPLLIGGDFNEMVCKEERRWMCFIAIVWMVWGERNNRIFRGKSRERQLIVNEAVQLVDKWKMELLQRRKETSYKGA